MKKTLLFFIVFFLLAETAFYSRVPSNNKNWQEDVKVLAYSERNNSLVTIHKIRDFHYKSELDYVPSYYDETFDSNKISEVNLLASYWMGPDIAHVFISFIFSDGKRVAFSIETRKEVGESYSTFKGFFREYELYIVAASENDLIGLRKDIRKNPKEDIYRYRIKGDKELGKELFLAYAKSLNNLKKYPQFYNTITTNCTTTIYESKIVQSMNLPFSWKVLASGHVPEYLYENGMLYDYNLTYNELQKKAHLNP